MVGAWLIVLGGAWQVCGIAVTMRGAVATWREFSPDEHLSAATWKNIAEWISGKRLWIRSKLGRTTPLRFSSKNQPPMIKISGRGSLRAGYSELDSNMELSAALAELDSRTRKLRNDLDSLSAKFSSKDAQNQHRLTALEKGLDRSVTTLYTQDRRIAIGGIQSILIGLVLIGVGVVLQTLSVLFPS